MFNCQNLLHPFQNDPGTSQRQRVIDSLLSDYAKIDGRSLADLLDYFSKLAAGINYYDKNLVVSDWQPFFTGSLPFLLTSISKYDPQIVSDKFAFYAMLFRKGPSAAGLQLMIHFIYYSTIYKIANWYEEINDQELPLRNKMEELIRTRLSKKLKSFISLSNAASKWFGTKKIDFSRFLDTATNDVWTMGLPDIYAVNNDFKKGKIGKCAQLTALFDLVVQLFASFLEGIKILGIPARDSIPASLVPAGNELQKNHPPHLALIFAFIQLFQKMQGELNKKTKEHLKYFYTEVLRIKPREPESDKANIVFEVQKLLQDQYQKYKLAKGTRLNGGRDNSNADIVFDTDDEIIVNETQVAEVRTLFLNNQLVADRTYVEGVYMAPKADKADGIDKDFKDDPKNWFTVGRDISKYIAPGKKIPTSYPSARTGFLLASPVLFLAEGQRTIDVTLDCKYINSICGDIQSACSGNPGDDCPEYPRFYSAADLFPHVRDFLFDSVANKLLAYIVLSKSILEDAGIAGMTAANLQLIQDRFLIITGSRNLCTGEQLYKDFTVVAYDVWEAFLATYPTTVKPETEKLPALFRKRYPFRIYFSGEKEWIEPSTISNLQLVAGVGNAFNFLISAKLEADKPAVTFYNKENLIEDFGTDQPLLRVELDDMLKMAFTVTASPDCCLEKTPETGEHFVSLYHFFRNVTVESNTKIEVSVCGLKNFVVQNDENLMDVNAPIYPFGTRPDVIDFDLVKSTSTYCISAALIADAGAAITAGTRNFLQALINPTGSYKVGTTTKEVDDFLAAIPGITAPQIGALTPLIEDASKNYCQKNYIGPNFYIGSKEVFRKKWSEVYVNFNWKDKPADFNEYYIGYWADPVLPPAVPPPGFKQKYGLDKENFEINLSVLQDKNWKLEKGHPLVPPAIPPPRPAETTILNPKTKFFNRRLFPDSNTPSFCTSSSGFEQTIFVRNDFITGLVPKFTLDQSPLERFDGNAQDGFLKINLQNQDFMHKDYAFVLARQMMALGKYPDSLLEGAVYRDLGSGTVIVFSNLVNIIFQLKADITAAKNATTTAKNTSTALYTQFNTDADFQPNVGAAPIPPAAPANPAVALNDSISDPERNALYTSIYNALAADINALTSATTVETHYQTLEAIYSFINIIMGKPELRPLNIPIPAEPWTPIIKNISIDYKASATIADIDLIHLYPFANTHKAEEIELSPTLFPTFCDEGTLFIALSNFQPGVNLNLLFQMAEATADSETGTERVHWHYLDNNIWKPLRSGFEVLEDGTLQLTSTGIVKFATPENMSVNNTIMPAGLYWIKASLAKNSRSVSETFSIYTQAISATFELNAANDKNRLSTPLPKESIAKLLVADPAIKQVTQPDDSFGGKLPELDGSYYLRVSELLRHKGRAIQKWDYERIVLEKFPQLYKAKCINHSFHTNAHIYSNDVPYAPGYVILALIPDLTKMKAGNSFEPRVPVSLLEKTENYLKKMISPFVRLKSANPRYEKVNFCITVRLQRGKDENFYREQLKTDLSIFLAPWAVGKYDKLSFGQCVYRSDVLRFLEQTDYVDFIRELRMAHEYNPLMLVDQPKVCPLSPRSILVAGNIDVIIDDPACEQWCANPVGVAACDGPELINDYCAK